MGKQALRRKRTLFDKEFREALKALDSMSFFITDGILAKNVFTGGYV